MCLLQDNEWWGPTIYYSKQNKLKTKTNDAPRTAHIIWSNKNIAHWNRTWYFCWWRGDARTSPSLTLVPLEYFLGWHGHPQAWAFVHSSSHHIILLSLHLKTHFIQNSNTILISSISIIKIIDQLVQILHACKTSEIT